jgi:hypothetical protein
MPGGAVGRQQGRLAARISLLLIDRDDLGTDLNCSEFEVRPRQKRARSRRCIAERFGRLALPFLRWIWARRSSLPDATEPLAGHKRLCCARSRPVELATGPLSPLDWPGRAQPSALYAARIELQDFLAIFPSFAQ